MNITTSHALVKAVIEDSRILLLYLSEHDKL